MINKSISIFLILIFLILAVPVYALENSATTDSHRIKPVRDKLAGMTSQDIEKNVNQFKDMKNHWSRIQVGKLIGLDIITVNGDGTFKPNDPMKVDQFTKMIVCAMGFKPGVGNPYRAQTYIDVARDKGLILKGEFAVYTKPITREQMAKILNRAFLLMEEAPVSKYDQYVIGRIKDYQSIADDCKQSVINAYVSGLMQGSDGKFNPKSSLTRAEASSVLIRFLDKAERRPMAPGADEIIKDQDAQGNWQEMYPGAVREYFVVAKALQSAIPKAKGYVDFGFNNDTGRVFVSFYKDEVSYKENILNMIGGWDISPETPDNADNPYASVYLLTVYNDELYKSLFEDYSHEVIKTIFGKDTGKAIALHDKYMNMRNNTLNRIWEETKLNSRKTGAFRDGVGFSFFASILGKK